MSAQHPARIRDPESRILGAARIPGYRTASDTAGGTCTIVESTIRAVTHVLHDAQLAADAVDCVIVASGRLRTHRDAVRQLRQRIGLEQATEIVVSARHGFSQAMRLADDQLRSGDASLVLVVTDDLPDAGPERDPGIGTVLVGDATRPGTQTAWAPLRFTTAAGRIDADRWGVVQVLQAGNARARINAVVRPLSKKAVAVVARCEVRRYELSLHGSPAGAIQELAALPGSAAGDSHALIIENGPRGVHTTAIDIAGAEAGSARRIPYDEAVERVREVVCELGGHPADAVTASTSFATDLAADTLFVAEVITELEQQLGLRLSEEVWRRSRSVGDVALALTERGTR